MKEGGPAVSYLQDQLQNQGGAADWFHRGWEWARQRATFLPSEQDVIAKITASVGRVAEFVAGQAGGLLKGVANFLFALVITLALLFFLLRDASSFARALRHALPFGAEQNERLIHLTSDLVSASVTATIAVAAAQGLIGGVTFALLGVSGAALWAVMMFLLAFLPLVGATLVWLPAAAWLALSGSLVKGAILALVGVLVLSNVDNVLRPLLPLRQVADEHPRPDRQPDGRRERVRLHRDRAGAPRRGPPHSARGELPRGAGGRRRRGPGRRARGRTGGARRLARPDGAEGLARDLDVNGPRL